MSTGGGTPTGDTAIRYQSEMPEVMARKLGLMDQAVNLAKTGQAGSYNPTLPTQQVAGFTGQQEDAFKLASQGVGSYQPFMQNAAYLANKAVDPNAYKDFLNPYQSYVTQGIQDQFAKAQNDANMQASQAGADAAQLQASTDGRADGCRCCGGGAWTEGQHAVAAPPTTDRWSSSP